MPEGLDSSAEGLDSSGGGASAGGWAGEKRGDCGGDSWIVETRDLRRGICEVSGFSTSAGGPGPLGRVGSGDCSLNAETFLEEEEEDGGRLICGEECGDCSGESAADVTGMAAPGRDCAGECD